MAQLTKPDSRRIEVADGTFQKGKRRGRPRKTGRPGA
jgi:hypothetical protein